MKIPNKCRAFFFFWVNNDCSVIFGQLVLYLKVFGRTYDWLLLKKIKNDFYTRNETLKSSMLYYTNKINKPKKKTL